jgi:NADH dehydrogenase/NADH:ubiquinone oxidoreductase subunit G
MKSKLLLFSICFVSTLVLTSELPNFGKYSNFGYEKSFANNEKSGTFKKAQEDFKSAKKELESAKKADNKTKIKDAKKNLENAREKLETVRGKMKEIVEDYEFTKEQDEEYKSQIRKLIKSGGKIKKQKEDHKGRFTIIETKSGEQLAVYQANLDFKKRLHEHGKGKTLVYKLPAETDFKCSNQVGKLYRERAEIDLEIIVDKEKKGKYNKVDNTFELELEIEMIFELFEKNSSSEEELIKNVTEQLELQFGLEIDVEMLKMIYEEMKKEQGDTKKHDDPEHVNLTERILSENKNVIVESDINLEAISDSITDNHKKSE